MTQLATGEVKQGVGERERKFLILFTIYITLVAVLNILTVKLVALGTITFTFGTYLYPFTFLFTDIIAEVWGRKRATRMVFLGFLASTIVIMLSWLAAMHPPAEFWATEDKAFRRIFTGVPRILLASMCAYLSSQMFDIYLFQHIKKKTGGSKLWLRNTISTISSQLLDTLIFTFVAFGGTISHEALLQILLGGYILKFLFAILDTPLAYLAVKWITGEWENQNLQGTDP